MKRKDDFLATAELLNMMRVELKGKSFGIKELKNMMHGILPSNDWSRTFMVRSKIIERVGHGKYAFPKEPIHWACVQRFYDQVRGTKKHTPKPEAKAPQSKTVAPPVVQEVEYDETKAVSFLKNRGYVILKMM